MGSGPLCYKTAQADPGFPAARLLDVYEPKSSEPPQLHAYAQPRAYSIDKALANGQASSQTPQLHPLHILSATQTPPAPSIIQFCDGQHWFHLGTHNPQRTARARL